MPNVNLFKNSELSQKGSQMPTRAAQDAATIAAERQKFKATLATALKEDDPLAVYDQFIQWTVKNYGEHDPESGLLELLEQATEAFKKDPLYKTDLRYLKLWCLYAKQVDRPRAMSIYTYLFQNDIGTSYSVLYEGYAMLLEAEGRRQDAENVYRKGIKRQTRPLERLKIRYKEFQSRSTSSARPPFSTTSSSSGVKVHTEIDRRNAQSAAASSVPRLTSTLANATPASRYAVMLAPADPGKRPEKMQCNLSLLYTDDQGEYSIQEARARSMGLLGKRWGPPAPAVPDFSRLEATNPNDSDDDQKLAQAVGGMRKSMMVGEPTVTINTKEALADVFGIYNSPEKTMRHRGVFGSKHAPLKNVELKVSSKHAVPGEGDVDGNIKTTAPAFRPFVDENAQSSKATQAIKLSPYIDPTLATVKTPLASRPALGVKGPASRGAKPNSVLEVRSENNFPSKVFTPVLKAPPLAPLRDVFTDQHGDPQPKPKIAPAHERAKSLHDISSTANDGTPTFAPFLGEDARTPFKVFSRPPEQSAEQTTPKPCLSVVATDPKPTFAPYRDPPAAFTPRISPEPESNPEPVQELTWSTDAVCHRRSHEDEQNTPDEQDDEYENQNDADEGYDMRVVTEEYADDEYDESGPHQEEIPLGGRFGKFNVMTPIAERTYEFTSSTRVAATPSERMYQPSLQSSYDDVIDEDGAVIAAKQLAEELREDISESEEERIEPFRLPQQPLSVADVAGKTGQLSLSDTLSLNSSFRPPNPCNPFDPEIMRSLLARIPTDPHFYDLREKNSNMLDGLQGFTKKTSRKAADAIIDFPIVLNGHKFSVSEKLGEGGFGAVFKAKDMGTLQDDDDLEDVDDDFEEEMSMVALKVVKPRNLWEYHMLRRLHSALPQSARRHVILPHALYAFRDESFLVLNYCPQGTLLNIVNGAVAAGVSQQGACLDELLVFFFTIELLRFVEACHNASFIHGDLKIDNCLLRLEEVPGGVSTWSSVYQPSGEGGWSYKGLKVIDFGRTIDTRLFPADQQYIADWEMDERDCFEMRENRPWTYQTDYFGLAGIVYCMLFGKYIQASSVVKVVDDGDVAASANARYKITTPLKRYWQSDIWIRLFDVLLNPCSVKPDGQLPVSDKLRELRREMEAWLQANCNRTSGTLKGLLKKVEVSCYVR